MVGESWYHGYVLSPMACIQKTRGYPTTTIALNGINILLPIPVDRVGPPYLIIKQKGIYGLQPNVGASVSLERYNVARWNTMEPKLRGWITDDIALRSTVEHGFGDIHHVFEVSLTGNRIVGAYVIPAFTTIV